MKKITTALLCMITSCTLSAQNNFTITGNVELLSGSRSIIISSSSGQFEAAIHEDGSFIIKGIIDEAGLALIKTDSSGADGIWLQPGEYSIQCKEISRDGLKGYLFRIPELKGPEDAEIAYGFSQPRYYIKGESPEDAKSKNKIFAIHYIDSIFKYYPDSKTLPEMINLAHYFIGDEATEAYQSLLTADQKNDDYSKQLDYYFKRKGKIEIGKLFEDFTIQDNNGKNFTLSKLTGKNLILIDFWSSDCSPCRGKHKKLVELYNKYASRGVEIISVSLDDNEKEWQDAIKKDSMTWVNVSDLKGWNSSLAESYYVKSLPFSLWLDGAGKIIGTELSDKEIENYLK